ncbi:MAG: glycosyltransferase family 2 protein [Gammaproteobacteria bacterium]|nr:glycosyltransferase family 2 protein [Gammaproteobacteria bacterium]
MTVTDHPHKQSAGQNPTLSVVIPVFNEREVLPIFLRRITEAVAPLKITFELLFVDDGSSDGSGQWLLDRTAVSRTMRVIRLSRNFGKEAALSAGMDRASGDAVVVLDADLQDPPELIPEMLAEWRRGIDVVLMQRRERLGESVMKRFSASLYYRLLNRLSDSPIPPDVGDFRLMSRKAVAALRGLPERNRYMKGLFSWVGMPTVVLHYDRDPRAAGRTKWGYPALARLAWEGITSFSTKPLKLATLLGLSAAVCGAAYGAWIVFKALVLGDPVAGYPSLIAIITLLGGAQLCTIGIVGEYVGKIYIEAKQRPIYLIYDDSKDTAANRSQEDLDEPARVGIR